MKKNITILFLIPMLCFSKVKLFKAGERPHFNYGISMGSNTNFFKYKNINQRDIAIGYQAGVYFRVTRSKAFAQIGFNFMHSGIFLNKKINNTTNAIPYQDLSFRYNSLGIPITLGAIVYKKSFFKLRLFTGVEADFIANSKAKKQQTFADDLYILSKTEKRAVLKPAQCSFQAGVGMDVAMFTFDIKYNMGLVSFYKENYRTQTHLLQTVVGVIF